MGLLRVFVRRPVLTTMIVLVMLVMGLNGYRDLTTELIPSIDFPVIVVTTVYPGASPKEVESQVTQKIEDEIATLANIDYMRSESSESLSQVIVVFELETGVDQDAIDVKDKVDQIRAELPDAAEDPIIAKYDIASSPVVDLAVSADRPLGDVYAVVDQVIKERLSRIDGVAEVVVTGQREREIRVAVAPERLRAYGLTLTDIMDTLEESNLNVPAGNITRDEREITLRLRGEIESPQELADFRLFLPGGGTLPLSEVAEIQDTTEELRQATSLDGNPVIGVGVQKRSDGNTVEVAGGVYAALEELRATLDPDFRIDVVSEGATFVQDSVRDVLQNIGLGILLTGLLLFLFLHDWRTTAIAAVSMPVSVIATFLLMQGSGFTLNVMSLMALGISIGTLVTNSIVILENISRHIHEGMEPFEAAEKGTAEVAIAVLASTLTNIVVFTPIAFMSGIIGRIFLQFGLTVVFATLFSLVVGFTMVPMLAARLLRPGKGVGGGNNPGAHLVRAWDAFYDRVELGYRGALEHALHHRWQPLLGASVLFVASLLLFGFIGGDFFPTTDEGRLLVAMELPAGTSLERTQQVAARVERILRAHDEVESVLTKIGGEQRGVEDADISANLVDTNERDIGLEDFLNVIRPELAIIPDATLSVSPLGEVGSGEAELQIEVLGSDPMTVREAGARVFEVVRSIEGLVGVQTTEEAGKPQIEVVPRRRQLAGRGLTASTVGSNLRAAYEGEDAGVYREGGEEYDVVVRFADAHRRDPAYLESLPVAMPSGAVVPLSDVARLERTVSDPTIYHMDKLRMVLVEANTSTISLSEAKTLIDAGIEALDLPPGVEVRYGGDARYQDESFVSILEALVLAIVLLYLVMAAILESFIHPLTVMLTLPLGLIGTAVALFLTGETINVMSMMAFVMLIGIVVNNAILLLDYTQQLRAQGMGVREALLKACPTRLRPIVMANLAIAIGMLPQAMGGAGSEFRVPMAVVQIGGVLISAVFTLFVIPVVYTLFDRLTFAGRRAKA